jgi:hypothetical protein
MPTVRSLKPLAVLLVAAVALALPAAAQATLTYVHNPLRPVVFTAEDDGSDPRRVGPGYSPQISSDGASVAYFREGERGKTELRLAPVRGGAGKVLMTNLREPFLLTFSPDSELIAALRGGELGKRKLVVITVATGKQKVVASGYFSGFSFSPEGDQLVYAKSNSERYPPRSDVYRVSVGGGKPVALTSDRRSIDPLWGPRGQIVFAKLLGAKQRRYGPKSELYLMSETGRQGKRLTRTEVDPLLQGLIPTDWSADGKRILAEFTGQDTSYAVGVNAKTGAQHAIGRKGELGLIGSALSADGKFVLGYEGVFEAVTKPKVRRVPFSGGRGKVLVRNASEPGWSY